MAVGERGGELAQAPDPLAEHDHLLLAGNPGERLGGDTAQQRQAAPSPARRVGDEPLTRGCGRARGLRVRERHRVDRRVDEHPPRCRTRPLGRVASSASARLRTSLPVSRPVEHLELRRRTRFDRAPNSRGNRTHRMTNAAHTHYLAKTADLVTHATSGRPSHQATVPQRSRSALWLRTASPCFPLCDVHVAGVGERPELRGRQVRPPLSRCASGQRPPQR